MSAILKGLLLLAVFAYFIARLVWALCTEPKEFDE